jgi:nucleotide-binding universal stress UspA family protein
MPRDPTAYRRILCPVEASECSRAALRHAATLATHFDAELEALHVFSVPAYVQPSMLVWATVGPRPLWELAEEQAKRELDALLSSLPAEDRGRALATLEAGDPATVIVERAKRPGTDLVVMGTHGRTGARRLVLGSVAERVVRLAPCPVLVVPMGEASSTEIGDTGEGAIE